MKFKYHTLTKSIICFPDKKNPEYGFVIQTTNPNLCYGVMLKWAIYSWLEDYIDIT